MGQIKIPQPVKLIIGFIFKEANILNRAEAILQRRFGKIDFVSQALEFNHTAYYQKEFGLGLKRKFISFKKHILPGSLANVKIISAKIENKLCAGLKRTINIDPGYIDLAKLVLASTKDYKHRIYLDKGIYSEITLFYQDKSFRPWEWTYPDYRTEEYIAVFNKIRQIYADAINNLKKPIDESFVPRIL